MHDGRVTHFDAIGHYLSGLGPTKSSGQQEEVKWQHFGDMLKFFYSALGDN